MRCGEPSLRKVSVNGMIAALRFSDIPSVFSDFSSRRLVRVVRRARDDVVASTAALSSLEDDAHHVHIGLPQDTTHAGCRVASTRASDRESARFVGRNLPVGCCRSGCVRGAPLLAFTLIK